MSRRHPSISMPQDPRHRIAWRVGQELQDGWLVNLGIGLPTLVANYIPPGVNVILQSENGFVGLGPTPPAGAEDKDLFNAGGQPVSIVPGGACFDSATSFAIIRGGHIDATALGALQVDQEGNLASWCIPGKFMPGIGGAMDLLTGARRVIVAMEHVAKDGSSKVLRRCTLPLTAQGRINMIVTDYGVMKVAKDGLLLTELFPGVSLERFLQDTDAEVCISENLEQWEEIA